MRLKNVIMSRLFSQKQADLRSYPRFAIMHDRIGYAFSAGQPLGRILELGYGGFSIEREVGTDAALLSSGSGTGTQTTVEKRITLQLLDGRVDCLAIPKSETERFLGFAFAHESLQTYEFLRRYLPFMKCGAAMRYMIHNDQTNPKKVPSLLSEDEGVRASFEIDGYDNREIPLATIEMAENGVFFKLIRDTESVRTWHSIGPGGIGGTLHATPTPDPLILRKCLSYLSGYAGADYQIPVGRLIQNLLQVAEQAAFLPPHPKEIGSKERGPRSMALKKNRLAKVVPIKKKTTRAKIAAKRNSR